MRASSLEAFREVAIAETKFGCRGAGRIDKQGETMKDSRHAASRRMHGSS